MTRYKLILVPFANKLQLRPYEPSVLLYSYLYSFSASTCVISNHPCPTCLCFQVDSRVIIFIRWICKYICRRINRS